MLGNKEIMAQNIIRLMELKGVTRNEVCEALGFKYTTFTEWVKGTAYPRIDKIEQMANYFHVQKKDLVEEYKPRTNLDKLMEEAEKCSDDEIIIAINLLNAFNQNREKQNKPKV